MSFKHKHLLDLMDLSREEIQLILDTAESMKEIFTRSIKKVPTLRGKTIISLFYEPSTRTKSSFDLAGKRLSADMMSLSVSTSSVVKGESLVDTAKTMEAMGADAVIMRHSMPGAPHLLAESIDASVLNAGDGAHAHPTQALLDMYSIREERGKIAGETIAIVGDIKHSRVARSNIWALNKLGAKVRVVGPPTLIPANLEEMDVEVYYDLEEGLEGIDVVNILRIQLERQEAGYLPNLREYTKFYGVDEKILELVGDEVTVMHPGPTNRGVEITPEVAYGDQSVINEQVTNGVAIRMALLYLLTGGEKIEETAN
ncbi:aspartate carbamoyltransferase catalytic subunit [Acetohalobium arabaticum]|uniref:Aspartate carbamoyltransferase n=1 Tax=Acetohalobium arabaticum (strain ATCC 49924 / DSM 5501 / Z-7288) TaxID=574087 RepID=D9QPI8_ACEAZ|nr:aspartate carbamoyltransferase catalytic subunit [Acetohalobium arabaticum]ADL12429.1 aspartate carbamoyltransferase [Acetohalobium arabaticum DSM 5501]